MNDRRSGRGSQQDPIDDAFADTSVRDPTGLSNRVDQPYALRQASRSQNQPSVSSHTLVSSWLTGSQTQIQPGESSRANLTNTNAQSDMDLVSETSEQWTESGANFSEINTT